MSEQNRAMGMIHLMTATRKKPAILAAAACLVIAVLVFGFAFPPSAAAWDDCPKGVTTDCVYPGACGRYVDTNGDNICDRSQSDPATTTASPGPTATTTALPAGTEAAALTAAAAVVASAAPTTTTTTPPSGNSDDSTGAAATSGTGVSETGLAETAVAAPSPSGSSTAPFLTHYLVSPIAIGFFLIYGISFLLYKTKRMRVATHRKIWNVLLLATFLITGIFGIILTIQLDYRLPFAMPVNLLFWHVEAGIVMTLISLFHMGWHFNYYRNLVRKSRCRARAAEAAERVGNAEQRELALQARAARRVEHGHRPAREEVPQPIRRDMNPRPRVEPETQ